MEKVNTEHDVASLKELQAIEQAVDTLRNQIGKLEKKNAFLKTDNEYLLATLQERTVLLNNLRDSIDNGDEDEDIMTLNAEISFIAEERDKYLKQVINLENTNQQQKRTIEELQESLSKLQIPNPTGFNAVINSLKSKLGLGNTTTTE